MSGHRSTPIPPPPMGGDPKNIVVIGGGAVGALTTFELQRAGHQVTLLEARSWGNGSSSRSAACIRAQFDTPSTVRAMVYCTRYYERWTDIVGGAHTPIVQNGYLFLKDWSTDMNVVRRTVEMQNAAGLSEVEILDRAALDSRFPYLETTGIQGATWCPTDGFLDPARTYGDAVEAAKCFGAAVFQNAEVVEVVFDGLRPTAVKTADGHVFAGDIFVNTTGVWAPRTSALFNGYPLDIKARRRYLYFLEGFQNGSGEFMNPEQYRKLPMTITPRGCYCRPESVNGGMLMMGWLQPAKPIRPQFDNQDEIETGFSHLDEHGYGHVLRKEITSYLPDADKMGKIWTVTTGFYEDVPDHNPLIGFDPWVPNLVHAAGFSGHGLMQAPATAAIVSHIIAAGCNLATVELPLVGKVDVNTYAVDRVFQGGEGMVI